MIIIDNVPSSEIVQRVYKLAEREYRFDNGWTAKRESDLSYWVLRDEKGDEVDQDRFRLVLFTRHGLQAL